MASDTCGQVIIQSLSPHDINFKCQSCNEPGCSDPFIAQRLPDGQPFFGAADEIDRPVPAGSAEGKGENEERRGRFEPGSNVEIQSEHVAKLEYEGKDRLIRLFVLKVHLVEGSTVVGIGQETIDGKQETPLRAKRLAGIGHAHRVRIPGINLDFDVLTRRK